MTVAPKIFHITLQRGHRGRMVVESVQSVSITTKVVSSNPIHGEMNLIQHYVIMFVSDLQQVGCVLRFPPPIKLTAMI